MTLFRTEAEIIRNKCIRQNSSMMSALIKRLPDGRNFRRSVNPTIGLVDEFLYYAHELERSGDNTQVKLLDNLDHMISEYAQSLDTCKRPSNGRVP